MVAFADGVDFCSANKETSASSGVGYDSAVVGVTDGLTGPRMGFSMATEEHVDLGTRDYLSL